MDTNKIEIEKKNQVIERLILFYFSLISLIIAIFLNVRMKQELEIELEIGSVVLFDGCCRDGADAVDIGLFLSYMSGDNSILLRSYYCIRN